MKLVRRKRYPQVAICVDRAQKYGGQILEGIAKYVNIYGPWSFTLDPGFYGDYQRGWLKDWRGDGMLAYVEDLRLAKLLRDAQIPVVEVFGHRFDLGLPQVSPDGRINGELAAQHLLERNFKHFAYSGYRGHPWSEQRQAGFVDTLKKAGITPIVQSIMRQSATLWGSDRMQEQVNAWIPTLPLPIGVMACSDRHAQRVLGECRLANLAVQEEVAIIGSGNDEDLCHLSNPPLTSIMYDTERIGYEAARLLDRLMSGEVQAHEAGTTFVPPIGVITRRSTDVMAIYDRLVANTVRFIREHACEGLSVKQLVAEFGISKSTLYRQFTEVLGRSPHEEILRVQLERAKSLLAQSDLAVERIAELAGFQNTEYFYVAFKREMGVTPRAYRMRGLGKEKQSGLRTPVPRAQGTA